MRKTVDRTVLLETFEQLGGTTEYEMEDIRSFLQVKQYQELQDSTKFLIVGGRGAGKTCAERSLADYGI